MPQLLFCMKMAKYTLSATCMKTQVHTLKSVI